MYTVAWIANYTMCGILYLTAVVYLIIILFCHFSFLLHSASLWSTCTDIADATNDNRSECNLLEPTYIVSYCTCIFVFVTSWQFATLNVSMVAKDSYHCNSQYEFRYDIRVIEQKSSTPKHRAAVFGRLLRSSPRYRPSLAITFCTSLLAERTTSST